VAAVSLEMTARRLTDTCGRFARTYRHLPQGSNSGSKFLRNVKKGSPRNMPRGREGEERYSYTLYLTSAPDGVGEGQRHAPAVLHAVKRHNTHC
jgi:hypothetical protein